MSDDETSNKKNEKIYGPSTSTAKSPASRPNYFNTEARARPSRRDNAFKNSNPKQPAGRRYTRFGDALTSADGLPQTEGSTHMGHDVEPTNQPAAAAAAATAAADNHDDKRLLREDEGGLVGSPAGGSLRDHDDRLLGPGAVAMPGIDGRVDDGTILTPADPSLDGGEHDNAFTGEAAEPIVATLVEHDDAQIIQVENKLPVAHARVATSRRCLALAFAAVAAIGAGIALAVTLPKNGQGTIDGDANMFNVSSVPTQYPTMSAQPTKTPTAAPTPSPSASPTYGPRLAFTSNQELRDAVLACEYSFWLRRVCQHMLIYD